MAKKQATAADILSYALTDVWGRSGINWVKGKMHGFRKAGTKQVDTYCLIGGINAATRKLGASFGEHRKAEQAVISAIDHKTHSTYQSIVPFNDAHRRKFPEIKAVVCDALKSLVGKGA